METTVLQKNTVVGAVLQKFDWRLAGIQAEIQAEKMSIYDETAGAWRTFVSYPGKMAAKLFQLSAEDFQNNERSQKGAATRCNPQQLCPF